MAKSQTRLRLWTAYHFRSCRGEFLGIMGSSGSGKSTLLNCIATVIKPDSGTIELQGKEIQALKGAKLAQYRGREIGYLFQNFELLDNLTGRENIMVPLSIHGVSEDESRNRLEKLSSYLEIDNVLDKFPSQMSGGQRQRVAAAEHSYLIRGSFLRTSRPEHSTQEMQRHSWRNCWD